MHWKEANEHGSVSKKMWEDEYLAYANIGWAGCLQQAEQACSFLVFCRKVQKAKVGYCSEGWFASKLC